MASNWKTNCRSLIGLKFSTISKTYMLIAQFLWILLGLKGPKFSHFLVISIVFGFSVLSNEVWDLTKTICRPELCPRWC